jgi:hypothetical protein
MNKLAIIFLAVFATALALLSADTKPAPVALASAEVKNAVTVTRTLGRLQSTTDQSATLTVFAWVTKKDSAGEVLSEGLDTSTSFTVALTADQIAAIKAAFTADQAARAAAKVAAVVKVP